jgi:hypothetical protein
MVFSYNYLEANNEKLLQRKLVELQVNAGYTFKIINIYSKYIFDISWNKKTFKIRREVVAWYYANPKDALNGN